MWGSVWRGGCSVLTYLPTDKGICSRRNYLLMFHLKSFFVKCVFIVNLKQKCLNRQEANVLELLIFLVSCDDIMINDTMLHWDINKGLIENEETLVRNVHLY